MIRINLIITSDRVGRKHSCLGVYLFRKIGVIKLSLHLSFCLDSTIVVLMFCKINVSLYMCDGVTNMRRYNKWVTCFAKPPFPAKNDRSRRIAIIERRIMIWHEVRFVTLL